jgi:hypothetical protein
LPARFLELGRRKLVIDNRQTPVGRDDVDVIGLKARFVPNLDHWHARACRYNPGQFAAVLWVEVDNHDESRASAWRNRGKEVLQSLDAAR